MNQSINQSIKRIYLVRIVTWCSPNWCRWSKQTRVKFAAPALAYSSSNTVYSSPARKHTPTTDADHWNCPSSAANLLPTVRPQPRRYPAPPRAIPVEKRKHWSDAALHTAWSVYGILARPGRTCRNCSRPQWRNSGRIHCWESASWCEFLGSINSHWPPAYPQCWSGHSGVGIPRPIKTTSN